MKRVINIFLHIPRTGGTSLMKAIEKAIGKDKVIMHDTKGHISHKDEARMLMENERVEWFSGHEKFGIHKELPADVGVRYFTNVRTPCERLVSEFRFLRKCTPHVRHAWAVAHKFDDYMINKEKLFVLDNMQSRYLSGRDEIVTRYTEKVALKNVFYSHAEPNPIISAVTIDNIQQHIDRLVQHGILPNTTTLKHINSTKGIDVDYSCTAVPQRTGLVQDLMDEYTRYDNLLYDEIAEREEPPNKILHTVDKELNMPRIIWGEK